MFTKIVNLLAFQNAPGNVISAHFKSQGMTLSHEELFTVAEIAKQLRLSESALNKWRITGSGPKFIKVGRLVHYRRSDISEWLEKQVRVSTSDQGRAA
jgi:excisionase family DNA binding protein